MRSKLFKTAWAIASNYSTFSEALKQAWKVLKLAAKAKRDNVRFKFRKVTGEIREAFGTLNFEYERKTESAPKYGQFTYWDVEANGIRSAKVENIIF